MTAKRLQYMARSLLPSLRADTPHAVLITFSVSVHTRSVSRGSGSKDEKREDSLNSSDIVQLESAQAADFFSNWLWFWQIHDRSEEEQVELLTADSKHDTWGVVLTSAVAGRHTTEPPHHQKEEIDPYRTLWHLGCELRAASSQAEAGSDRLGKNRGEQRGADRQGGGKPHGLEEEMHDGLHSAHIRGVCW